jgi:Tol biopolymer transport system component
LTRAWGSTTLALICGVLAMNIYLDSQASSANIAGWHIQSVAFSDAKDSFLNGVRAQIVVVSDLQKKPVRLVVGVNPQWCPDGSKIAFVGFRGSDARSEIFTINPDGSGKKQLTKKEGGTGTGMPSWSADGKRIAFVVSGRDSKGPEIYVMGEDGTNPQFVTPGMYPHWSPNGSRLVFYRDAKSNAQRSSVWVVNLDGSGATAITDESSASLFPEWTRDGKIVFASNRSGRFAIYRMNPDGSGLEDLFSSKDSDFMWPTVSPDGKQLVVAATKLADSHDIRGHFASGARMKIEVVKLDSPENPMMVADGAHPSVLWTP